MDERSKSGVDAAPRARGASEAKAVSGYSCDVSDIKSDFDDEAYKKAERRARWKMDVQVVPLCLMLFLLSFLDRTNISQAAIEGGPGDPSLLESLSMSSHDFAVALTVLYPTYIILEVPSNLLIKRVGPRFWIPMLVMLWGMVETLQGLVTSKGGLYVNRVFLGATEAGILPGISVYLTFFYKPSELQFRQAFFITGASLSGAFSGLLAAAIRNMAGIAGQHGWQWIFYLEGIFTVVFGFLCLFILPNNAESCFLLNPAEKQLVKERLKKAQQVYAPRPELAAKLANAMEAAPPAPPAPMPPVWRRDVLRAFTDPRMLLMYVVSFCFAMPFYSIAYFSPTIVQQMGDYSSTKAMLMSCPPYAISFVCSLLLAIVSDRLRQRFLTLVTGFILTIIGFAVVLGCKDGMDRYGGMILLTCGSYSMPAAVFTWLANNASGYYKRATGLAVVIVFTNSAGLASTWLFKKDTEAPQFVRGNATNLAMSALGLILATVLELMVLYERRKRAQGLRDERVLTLYAQTRWDVDQMRTYLGDDHPEYALEI